MLIPRIYQNNTLKENLELSLDKSASNHIAKVLRLSVGNSIIIFNGNGARYSASITAILRNKVIVKVFKKDIIHTESPLNIHLFQGVSRSDKMDFTLQKGVELGVKSFTPVITKKCGVKLNQQRWQKKHDHWKKIIISACEQSGRDLIPSLNKTIAWDDALIRLSQDAYFLDPNARKSFKDFNKPNLKNELQLWVGPEGGFSDIEISQIKQQGTQPIYLGPRILRTETAALAAVSSLNALWGDF